MSLFLTSRWSRKVHKIKELGSLMLLIYHGKLNNDSINETGAILWRCYLILPPIELAKCPYLKTYDAMQKGSTYQNAAYLWKTSGKYIYNGCSKVVVSKNTPMIATYKTEVQKVDISFYIQRYDLTNQAVDLPLQSRLNQIWFANL